MCSNRTMRMAAALLLAAGCAVNVANAQSLTTTTSNNGSGGVYMDLTATAAPLDVTSFETYFQPAAGSQVPVEVWIRPGSYIGFETDPTGWTLVDTVVATSAGSSDLAPITLNAVIPLAQGATVGLLLQATQSSGIRYHGTSTSPPQVLWTNPDLSLYSEHATTSDVAFGGSIFTPRTFAGVVNYQPGSPDPGACCFNDGTCQDLPSSDCFAQGGTFQGAGTGCATTNCPQPGACCFDDGTCQDLLESLCNNQNGTWQGPGTDCATANCPEPGACCFTNGGCSEIGPIACANQGGSFSGHGTECATICPPPSDKLVPPTFIAPGGGAWAYDPSYTQTLVGTEDAHAFRLIADALPRDTGAAWHSDIEMELVSPNGTTLLVGGNTSNWNNALVSGTGPQGTGNPHSFDGTYLHEFGPIDGTWSVNFRNTWSTSNLSWDNIEIIPITLETGACCMDDGSCSELNEIACDTEGGVYHGNNTQCATVNCPQPGACCLATACTEVLESACGNLGGTFEGENTQCATANCPTMNVGNIIGFNFTTATAGAPDPQNWTRISAADGFLSNVNDDTGTPTAVNISWGGGATGGFVFLGTSTLAPDAVPQHAYDLSGMTGYGFRSDGEFTIELSGLTPDNAYQYWFVAYRSVSAIDNLVHVSAGDVPNAISFSQSITAAENDGRFVVNETNANNTMLWDVLASSTTSSSTGTITFNWAGVTQTTVIGALAIREVLDPPCYADCNNDGELNVADFLCFIDEFAIAQTLPPSQQQTHYANCSGATSEPFLSVADFLCFIDEFAQGCP